jgi:hypothetical protein
MMEETIQGKRNISSQIKRPKRQNFILTEKISTSSMYVTVSNPGEKKETRDS